MKLSAKWLLLAVTILAAFGFGVRHGRLGAAAGGNGRKVLYWADPMHPSYRSDKPGVAPDCGMQLEPVYQDGSDPVLPSGLAFGTVRLDARRRQLIGLQTALVERRSGSRSLRTTGRVAADESRLYRVDASTSLWIRRVHGPTTGSVVRKNDPLLSFYTTGFLGNAAAYVFALDTLERQKAAGMTSPDQQTTVRTQIRQGVEGLQNLGVSDVQIERLARTRKIDELVDVVSPADGVVLERLVSPGQYLEPGALLYRIADLRRVWVLADLYDNEMAQVRPGQRADVRAPGQQRVYAAVASRVPPIFDPVARTHKLRLEVDNPGQVLRPDMFVDVELPLRSPTALSVPSEAVLDSGLKKTVFVDRGNGFFEPRRVLTGARFGDRVEILRGLMAGERVVVSGNFLLDSESRMRMASAGVAGANAQCVVCGMPIDESKMRAAGRSSRYRGRVYVFCTEECKREFDAVPERHAWAAGSDAEATPETAGPGKGQGGAQPRGKPMPEGERGHGHD